jgi:hypothetical protein
MKRASAFPYTQAAFRGTNGFIISPFPYESYPWIASELRSSQWTIQLDRRPLVAGANGGGIKAPSKLLSKLLQNSRVLEKLFQTNLWRFCWISMGYKFSKRPLMLSKFFASDRPLSAAFCLILRCSPVDGAFIAEQRPRSREF